MSYENDPRFLKGIEEFNQGLFFESHETLEEIWLEERGEDRKFFQGLIQIAAGYFKLQQGVPAGAIKLWRMGLDKLALYGPTYEGIALESLNDSVRASLELLEVSQREGTAPPTLEPPLIHILC
jgi:predicted metal-dependent hydrolase